FIMQYDNGRIKTFTKAGLATGLNTTENPFWNAAGLSLGGSSNASGDPRLLYDPLSQRWFATAFTGESTNNKILIARSETTDPTGTWKAISLNPGASRFHDFPTLGVDQNGLYVGTNDFTAGLSFTGVTMISLPKADLLAATPTGANATMFVNVNASTYTYAPQGVTWLDPGQPTASPAVGHFFGV